MGSFGIILGKVDLQPILQGRYGVVIVNVNIFVLERAPKTLDEDIIEGPATTVHAHTYARFFECIGKGFGRELNALVGVEDVGFPLL